MDKKKLLAKALSGTRNLKFQDLVALVEEFGFRLARVNGSHHIFAHPRLPELVNLQEVRGKAKPYQVWQFLKIVEKHDLKLGE